MYYEYLFNLYLLIWLICSYVLYRLVKAEILIFRIKYHGSENRIGFVASRVLRILFSTAVILLLMYGARLYTDQASAMKEKAEIAFNATSSPSRILCMSKTTTYFNDGIIEQVFFAPEFYAQCIRNTLPAPNRDFCEFVSSEHAFRDRCEKTKIKSWQCTLLLSKARKQC